MNEAITLARGALASFFSVRGVPGGGSPRQSNQTSVSAMFTCPRAHTNSLRGRCQGSSSLAAWRACGGYPFFFSKSFMNCASAVHPWAGKAL